MASETKRSPPKHPSGSAADGATLEGPKVHAEEVIAQGVEDARELGHDPGAER